MTGKNLKNKLESMGIPLRQVAESLCISEQNLQNKMSSADIKVSSLCKRSKVLHKSIYYFLDGQDFYEENPVTFKSSKSETTPNNIIPDLSISLRLMDKLGEKDLENKTLNFELRTMAKELATLKERLRQLETREQAPDHPPLAFNNGFETFISDSSNESGESFTPTANPISSKRLSDAKT